MNVQAEPRIAEGDAATASARRWLAAVCTAAVLTVACGGGGGGGDAPAAGTGGPNAAAGFQLNFQPGTLTADYYQGEPPFVALQVRATQAYPSQVQVAVVDTSGVTTGQVQVTAASALVYDATMRLSDTLMAGDYTGNIEVRVCEDAPLTCARPVPGSPWRLPYRIKVRSQTNSTPLQAITGVADWEGLLGGGTRNASRSFSSTAAAFTRRWTAPSVGSFIRQGPAVVAGGLVITVSRDVSSGAPALIARREVDGSVAWQRALGTVNDEPDGTPTVSGRNVYLFASDWQRTIAWRVDLETGSLLTERSFDRTSSSDQSPIVVNGYVYSCRRVIGTDSGLTRFDATTLQAEPAQVPSAPVASCRPASDGTRLYVVGDQTLVVLEPGNVTPVYTVPLTLPLGVTDVTTVLDGSGRAFVSAYSLATAQERTSALLAIDTTTRQVLWSERGGFESSPVIVGNTLFVINGLRVEARSVSSGSLLWSVSTTSPSGLGGVENALVATGSHVFVASNWTTDAIDPVSRSVVWSDNVGGPLSLSAQGVLHIVREFFQGQRAVNLR